MFHCSSDVALGYFKAAHTAEVADTSADFLEAYFQCFRLDEVQDVSRPLILALPFTLQSCPEHVSCLKFWAKQYQQHLTLGNCSYADRCSY